MLFNLTGATNLAEFWLRAGSTWTLLGRTSLVDRGTFTLSPVFIVLNPGDDLVGIVGGTTGVFTGYASGALLNGAPS